MKTLKTIAILPLVTLLIACGGGGKGYSASIPEPTFELSSSGDSDVITISATSIEVPENLLVDTQSEPELIVTQESFENNPIATYQFKQFGDWDIGIQNDGYLFTFKFNEINAPPIQSGDFYADYEGIAFAKRLDGEVVSGRSSISITDVSGELSSFQFNGFDGIEPIEFVFDFPIPLGQEINHTTESKGIRANFNGNNFIGGAFYEKGKTDLGAFGATRVSLP